MSYAVGGKYPPSLDFGNFVGCATTQITMSCTRANFLHLDIKSLICSSSLVPAFLAALTSLKGSMISPVVLYFFILAVAFSNM